MEQKQERHNVYIPEYGVVVNVPKTDDATTIRWKFEQKMRGARPSDFIGQYRVNWENNTKQVQYDRLESVNRIKNLGDDKVQAGLFQELKRDKEIAKGRETRGITTFGKSIFNQVADLTLGSVIKGEGIVEDTVAQAVAALKKDELKTTAVREKFIKDVNKMGQDIVSKRGELAGDLGFTIREGESKFAQGFGSVVAPFVMMGMSAISKGLTATESAAMAVRAGIPLAGLFGISSGEDMYEMVRTGGGSLTDSYMRGTGAGLGEFSLELLGLGALFKGIKAKWLWSYPISAMATGAVQESAQSLKDMVIAGKYDKRPTEAKLDELIDSAIWGSIGEVIGLGVGYARTTNFRQMIRNKAVEEGYDYKTANNIAMAVTQNPENVAKDILDVIERELDNPVKPKPEVLQKMKADYEEARYYSAEADNFIEFEDNLYNVMASAGVEEDIARQEAKLQTILATNIFDEIKKANPDMTFQEFEDRQIRGIIKHKDSFYNKLTEDEQERYAIMAESGVSEEDIKKQIEANRKGERYFQMNTQEPKQWQHSSYAGEYMSVARIIELYKGENPTTLTNELGHYFFSQYFDIIEKYGRQEQAKEIYQWIGKDFSAKFSVNDWEKINNAFNYYIATNNAPNMVVKSLFERAKKWLVDVKQQVEGWEKPSKEVSEFFERLIAKDMEIPDLTSIKERERDLLRVLYGVQTGKEVSFKNFGIKEIGALQSAIRARIPRGDFKTIADMIAREGGIRAGTKLANSLGYDPLKKQKIFKASGVFDSMDSLREYLVEKGVLVELPENYTYEQLSEQENKVRDIIDNAENIYTEKERRRMEIREAAVANLAHAQEIVDDLLKDNKLGIKNIEELDTLLSKTAAKLKKADIVMVNKNAISYMQEGVKKLRADYKKLLADKNEERYAYQDKLKNYIKGLEVSGDSKVAMMASIQRVKDKKSYERVLEEIKERAERHYIKEQKHLYRNIINEILKSTKPRKQREQRYLYEDNTFFATMRKLNSLTEEQAEAELRERLAQQFEADSIDNVQRFENLFLSYKAKGYEASLELIKSLAEELQELKHNAILKKEEYSELKGVRKLKKVNEVLEYLDNTPTVKWTGAYLKSTNLYSQTAELFGKKWADKYEMETVVEDSTIKTGKIIRNTYTKAMDIYGVKRYGDFLNIIQEKAQKNEDWVLYGVNRAKFKLSVLDIMDIYLGFKNKETRENFLQRYEQFDESGEQQTTNLKDLLSNLTENDRKFADLLQETVNSFYDEENAVYVRQYGIDMPKIENYWARTSETMRDIDVYERYMQRLSQTPSFHKERATKVVPVPKDAWVKFQEHIAQMSYITKVAEKYKEISEIIRDKNVKNAIINKYDEKRYSVLLTSVNELSLNGIMKEYDYINSLVNTATNNFVAAKVGYNPAVFVKQLASITNYAVNMPVREFVKNLGYAVMNPIKTKAFMEKYAGDFLENRFIAGQQSEAIGRMIKGAKSLSNKKFSIKAGFKYELYNKLSYLVRLGDILPIYAGGYARLKYMLDKGMTQEEAVKNFKFETLRAQQSGNAASTATYQKAKGWAKPFLAFLNTPAQFVRIMADSTIQMSRGEISKKQYAKTMVNYMVVQSVLYQVLTNAFSKLLNDDDDKDWTDGLMTQILISPFAGYPILGDMVRASIDTMAGLTKGEKQKNKRIFNILLLQEIEQSYHKLAKEDKGVYDYVDIISPLIEAMTALPVKTAERWSKRVIKLFSD